MADDFTVRMEEEEDQNNPAGVPECLVDHERRMHTVGLGEADSEDISKGLVREVFQKAVPLELSFARPGINFEIPGLDTLRAALFGWKKWKEALAIRMC